MRGVLVAALFAVNYRRDEAQHQAVVATQNLAATLDLTVEARVYLKAIVEQRLPFEREYRIVRPADGRNPRIPKSGRQCDEFYRSMWEAVRSDGYWIGEIWNRRKDGLVFPEWLSISAVRDERGQVTNHVSVFVDISQRIAAGQALRESEHIYRTMFDSAPEGACPGWTSRARCARSAASCRWRWRRASSTRR